MRYSTEETTDDEDEIIYNHCLHLAHALIKDAGISSAARDEIGKMADIINDAIK